MEHTSMGRNGGMKLPVGYPFMPTDEQQVVHYLNRKARSVQLPAQVIPELNVFQTNSWDLVGDSREKRFFFWKKKRKWRKNRGRTESGIWKAMRKEKHVVGFSSNQAIGVKKTFVFYEGKQGLRGSRTQRLMHEYRLLRYPQSRPNTLAQALVRETKMDWVVCKIYKKKKKWKKKVVENDNVAEIITIDINDWGCPQISSSYSSGVSCDGAATYEQEISSAECDVEPFHPQIIYVIRLIY